MRAYILTILAAWTALIVGIALAQRPIEKPLLVTAQPASMIVCALRQADDVVKRERTGRIVKT